MTKKGILSSITGFIQYWYMRYLLVTELYMVEKWERVMMHIVFFMIFSALSLFNITVVLQAVTWTTNQIYYRYEDELMEPMNFEEL